jgi:hypothetical protein
VTANTATEAFARAEYGMLAHLPAAGPALAATLAADPNFALAHAVQGLGALSLARTTLRPAAAAALARARACPVIDARAAAFVAALDAFYAGNMRDAATHLETHLQTDPSDALAFKMAHSIRFMAGDAAGMLRASTVAAHHFPANAPHGSFVLGCHAFSLEESGDYAAAETVGLAAVEADPADAWGLHAVAHVYEMTGQTQRGAAWLETTRLDWQSCNNFGLHVAWHLALFRLELGEGDAALALYDAAVRPTASEEYRDVANAVSLLVRIEQSGIGVGGRWAELADHAARFAQDSELVFAMLHRLVASLRAGDNATAAEIAAQCAARVAGDGDQGRTAAYVGAQLAARLIGAANAGADIGAWLSALPEIGGSHAQRDLFVRMLAHDAFARGDWAAARGILAYRHRNRVPDRFSRLVQPRRAIQSPMDFRAQI